jgi:hypothetical protein
MSEKTPELSPAQKEVVGDMQKRIERMYEMGNQPFSIARGSNLPGEEVPNQKGGPATVMPSAYVPDGGWAPGLTDPQPLEQRDNRKTFREKIVNLFASQHRDEIDALEMAERTETQAVKKLEWLRKRLENWDYETGSIKLRIQRLMTNDIVNTFYHNMTASGHDVVQIANDPILKAVLVLNSGAPGSDSTIGELLIKRVDEAHAALQKELSDHIEANRLLLQKLGLI